MMNNWNRPGMQEGYRYNYGKRSADADAEPEAFYGPYSNNWVANMPMMSGFSGNWNMPMMNRPGMQEGYRFNYGKRSADADAEADADAFYGPNGYSWGYNGNNNNWRRNGNNRNMMNNGNNRNMMNNGNNWNMMNNGNNWNRPYNMMNNGNMMNDYRYRF